ncbi:hypothetical protein CMI37_37800, partial [Candidatus Pacearchaeota archaeon]|nr:hypothetical protein [Candidatus Pacearchaeota archaeon]
MAPPGLYPQLRQQPAGTGNISYPQFQQQMGMQQQMAMQQKNQMQQQRQQQYTAMQQHAPGYEQRGYTYPDIYPPTSINPENVPLMEESAGSGPVFDGPLIVNPQSSAEFLLELNQMGLDPNSPFFAGDQTGPTLPVYQNNPIDYTAPWNVGQYQGYQGYDEPGGEPWPSQFDLDNLELDQRLGIPPNVAQNTAHWSVP